MIRRRRRRRKKTFRDSSLTFTSLFSSSHLILSSGNKISNHGESAGT
jgi:hypothetical protein